MNSGVLCALNGAVSLIDASLFAQPIAEVHGVSSPGIGTIYSFSKPLSNHLLPNTHLPETLISTNLAGT